MKESRARSATPPGGTAPLLPPQQAVTVHAVIARLQEQPGALLPILHGVQDALGYVPEGAVAPIAQALNLTRAEVHGVLTFYHWYRREPSGRHVLHLCRAEACQAVGATALEQHAKRMLGTDFHGTSLDGTITLEPVYCLGNCACGPSLLLDGELHARVTPQRFDALIAEARKT